MSSIINKIKYLVKNETFRWFLALTLVMSWVFYRSNKIYDQKFIKHGKYKGHLDVYGRPLKTVPKDTKK